MPLSNEEELKLYIRSSVRRLAWCRQLFQNLGVNPDAGDFGGTGSKAFAACRAELLRVAEAAVGPYVEFQRRYGEMEEEHTGAEFEAALRAMQPFAAAAARDASGVGASSTTGNDGAGLENDGAAYLDMSKEATAGVVVGVDLFMERAMTYETGPAGRSA